MQIDRETVQQALDAQTRVLHLLSITPGNTAASMYEDCKSSITALREALAAPEQEPLTLEPMQPKFEILHRMKYHHFPATDIFPDDFELYTMDVECKDCIDVLIVKA